MAAPTIPAAAAGTSAQPRSWLIMASAVASVLLSSTTPAGPEVQLSRLHQAVRFAPDSERSQSEQVMKLRKDCNGCGEGCFVYPGVATYTDNREVLSTRDSHGVSTIIRTAYPRVTYTYRTYMAIQDAYRFIDGGLIWKFIYQFRRGVIYH